jgi:hypothetical protein
VANYAALLTAAVLGLYALCRAKPRQRVVFYVLGLLVSGAFLLLYHQVAFGSPFVTANQRQVAGFMNDEGRWLGILGPVDFRVLFEILVGPYRGLFFSSPILILGMLGLERMIRRRKTRAEGLVCAAVFVTVVAVNASFYRWDGGSTFAPRYLIPAIPFLALPLAGWFGSHLRLTVGLATLSAAMMLLATAVSPQLSVKIARPYTGYFLPLVLARAADPGLDPVSANRTGVYELDAGPPVGLFGPESPQARWSSFNLGEFIWPHRRLSLLPWFVGVGLGLLAIARASRRNATRSAEPPQP